MKLLIILGLLFAYSQAETEPLTVQGQTSLAIEYCVEQIEDADLETANKLVATEIVPEDDAEIAEFFACYWKQLGLITDDGEVNQLPLKVMIPYRIRAKYPEVSNPEEVAANAVDHCKDTKSDSVGQTAVKYRNCMINYAKDQHE